MSMDDSISALSRTHWAVRQMSFSKTDVPCQWRTKTLANGVNWMIQNIRETAMHDSIYSNWRYSDTVLAEFSAEDFERFTLQFRCIIIFWRCVWRRLLPLMSFIPLLFSRCSYSKLSNSNVGDLPLSDRRGRTASALMNQVSNIAGNRAIPRHC